MNDFAALVMSSFCLSCMDDRVSRYEFLKKYGCYATYRSASRHLNFYFILVVMVLYDIGLGRGKRLVYVVLDNKINGKEKLFYYSLID